MADASVDHVICDPPYEAEAHTQQRRTKQTFGSQVGGGDTRGCAIKPVGFAPMTPDVRDVVALEMARIARRWVISFCQAEAVSAWRKSYECAGLIWKRSGIWVKPDGQPQLTGDRPGMGYESLAIAHRPGKSRWNGGGRHGVWNVATKSDADAERTGHPTQKPVALMLMIVSDFTDSGETILDPFAGSGTTGVACIRLGRNFIGFERDENFHAAACKRLEGTREQLSLFPSRKRGKQKQETLPFDNVFHESK